MEINNCSMFANCFCFFLPQTFSPKLSLFVIFVFFFWQLEIFCYKWHAIFVNVFSNVVAFFLFLHVSIRKRKTLEMQNVYWYNINFCFHSFSYLRDLNLLCNKEKKTLSVIFLKLNLSTKEGENRGLKSIAEKKRGEEKKRNYCQPL